MLGRASLAESAAGLVDAAGAVVAARPDARFLPALRRSNVNGALDMGLAPGLLPGRVTLDDGRDWFAGTWPTVPATAGLDTEGVLRAAADGRIDVLVLLGADPLADFPTSTSPSGPSPGREPSSRSTPCSTPRAAKPTSCSPPPASPRRPAPPPTSKAG